MEADFASIVAAAGRGDQAAFEQLYTRLAPDLVAYIRGSAGDGLLGKESAIDIAQSVMREVLQDAAKVQIETEGSVQAWVYCTAHRKICDRAKHWRRQSRDPRREQALSDMEATLAQKGYGPLTLLRTREELLRIESAIQQLPENQKEAVLQVKVLGRPYPEVATDMGLTESAVRSLVSRGLAGLANLLE